MQPEKYEPVPEAISEEIKRPENILTPVNEVLATPQNKKIENREKQGPKVIDQEAIDSDPDLMEFLSNADVSRSRRGDGVFISGIRGTDTTKFRKYGISVPGCLIIPTKEDVGSEVDRISNLVTRLKQEVYERKRKVDEKKHEVVHQEKERGKREAKEKLMAEYTKVFEEFPNLALRIEDDEYNPKILNSEGRPVWGLNYTVEGYLKIKAKNVVDFRDAARFETQIRDFRNNNIQRVADLNNLALKNHAMGISPQNWEGEGAGQYSQNQSDYYAVSHSLYFDRVYEWTDSDINNLEKVVREKISDTLLSQKEALEKLKSYPIAGSSVIAKSESFSSEGSFPTRIEINGEVIPFPTLENAKEAETWALDNGAFLPYHNALGERLRDQAKREQWSERRSKIALNILGGYIPEPKEYTYEGRMPDHKGGGRTTGHATGWFVKDEQLGSRAADKHEELKFALKLFCELNAGSTILQAKQIPDFNAASDDELEDFATLLVHDKKSLEK